MGFDPSLNTVIVAHQGTDPEELYVISRRLSFISYPRLIHLLFSINSIADLTDLDIEMTTLSPSLFPGVPSSVEVHQGFADEQIK